MLEGEEVKPYRVPVTLMQFKLRAFFLLNICASAVGRAVPRVLSNQIICVCICTCVSVCNVKKCGERWVSLQDGPVRLI